MLDPIINIHIVLRVVRQTFRSLKVLRTRISRIEVLALLRNELSIDIVAFFLPPYDIVPANREPPASEITLLEVPHRELRIPDEVLGLHIHQAIARIRTIRYLLRHCLGLPQQS